ncbi:hypothetical protein A2U01_0036243 [Trifolium medium]|uniref:Uncharacterized protein n=1 Tax=Trifolium medium TaxID=97028 RepID=A0A392PSN1_9FABA|nr:hypothetical protein [Trifolium medium]
MDLSKHKTCNQVFAPNGGTPNKDKGKQTSDLIAPFNVQPIQVHKPPKQRQENNREKPPANQRKDLSDQENHTTSTNYENGMAGKAPSFSDNCFVPMTLQMPKKALKNA